MDSKSFCGLFLLHQLPNPHHFLVTWVRLDDSECPGQSVSQSVQSLSRVLLCDPMDCSTPGFTVHHQLPELAQTQVHRVGDAIQPSHPLSSPCPPAFNLAQRQGLFQWVSSSHQVAKVLKFQLQHQPSNEYSGLISFRMDWLDPLAAQGTLKSLLQHHSLKSSVVWHSAFFVVQLSHPYMTTGKTIALTRRTFVDKVMSLLFNTLSGSGQDVHIWRCVYAKENKIFHLYFIYGMGMGADGFA